MKLSIGRMGACVVGVLAFGVLPACTSQRLAYDHRVMRSKLLELYDEQLMDNLIRAYNGRPLLQIKYGVMNGTSKTNAELSGTIAGDNQETISIGNDDGTFSDKDTSNISGKASIESTMAISGTPVLDDPGLVQAYRDFAARYLRRTEREPTEPFLLHEERTERAGAVRARFHYWIPRSVPSGASRPPVLLADELAALADRVMLDRKKGVDGSLPDAARIFVLSVGSEPAVSGGDCAYTLEAFAPVGLAWGVLELEESERLRLDGDVSYKKSQAVTGLLLPEAGAPTDHPRENVPASRRRFTLHVPCDDLAAAAQLKGKDAAAWLASKIEGRTVTVRYDDGSPAGVDLNELGALLRDKLK